MNYYLQSPYLHRVLIVVLVDALSFATAAFAAWWMVQPSLHPSLYAALTALGAGGCFVTLYYCDAYRPALLGSARHTLSCVASTMGLALCVALVIYFGVPTPSWAVETLAHTAALYFPLLVASRLGFRAVSALPRFQSRVVVVGASDLGVAIARAMQEHPDMGTEFVGFLSDEPELAHRGASIAGFPVIGRVHEIEKIVNRLGIGWIVVASKSRSEHFPADVLLSYKLRSCRVESGVAFYERITGRIHLDDLRPSYLIFSEGFRQGRVGAVLKRVIDLVGASLALLLAAPVLLACAVAIRLDSRGPVFYRQERLCRDGRIYRVWKLRSMRDDAERESGPVFARESDDRVTRVGRILRKTRLDEFPQLLNVVAGDMSLVGPRPERPEFVEWLCARYPYFRLRSALKPGITGWAQIRYGYVNEIDGFEDKLALDLYYMKRRSLLMDLLILWHTVKTVILLRGV